MCCIALMASAQIDNLPRKVMNGREYYVYKVEKGEGFISISNKFNISQEDIIKYNPSAKNGLKRDQVLFIPVEESHATQAEAQNVEPFRHTVRRGETLYAISKMYGVSVDEICALNPGSRKRIYAGDTLLIPQKGQNVQNTQSANATSSTQTATETDSYIYHTIVKGETLYVIAKRYDVTVESIMRANPGIRPTKLYEGAVIRVPDNSKPQSSNTQSNRTQTSTTQQTTQQAVSVENNTTTSSSTSNNTTTQTTTSNNTENSQASVTPSQEYDTYEVKKRETLYSIARKFDITVEELIAANPGVNKLRQGMTINIPKQEQVVSINDTTQVVPNDEELEELYSVIYTKRDSGNINVAIILPFCLNKEPNIKSMLYTEYYQGFLLAVDSLKREGYSVNVAAYDTEESIEKVEEILLEPRMTLMDLIIAPEQEDAINMIADFGEKYDINVVNSFSMKNEKVNYNARVFQTNIPGSYFYAETVTTFINLFGNRNIVFLTDENRADESNEFIDLLTAELNNQNIPYSTCTYVDMLTIENMTKISKQDSIIFVPTSNKKDIPAQVIEGIETFRTENPYCNISLFGYPSWVPQVNKNISQFYKLDTYIFSRFYTHPDDKRLFDFDKKFIYWYNTEIKNASPRYALLGYDTGIYFLSAIARNGKNFANYDVNQYSASIQTDFRFERINNWSGFINKAFYLIHFSPNMTIEKICK